MEPSFFEDSIKFFSSCIPQVSEVDHGIVSRWLEMLHEQIEDLTKLMDDGNVAAANKRTFQALRNRLLSIQQRIYNGVPHGGSLSDQSPMIVWNDAKSAFKNCIRSGVITNLKHIDVRTFLIDASSIFETKVKVALNELDAVHIDTVFAAEFKIVKKDEEIIDIKYFNTKGKAIFQTTDLREHFLNDIQESILRDIEEMEVSGSGWSLHSIINLTVFIKKYVSLHGGNSFIELLRVIKNRKACINVVNNDEQCFKWSVLVGLRDVKNKVKTNRHRVAQYREFENLLNFRGIDFPVKPHQIVKFEKQNEVSVNVYFLKRSGKNFSVCTLHNSDFVGIKREHVNLLYIQNIYFDENDPQQWTSNEQMKYHYVFVNDTSRLFSSQVSKAKISKPACDRCMRYFHSKEDLMEHVEDCFRLNKCKVILPSEENSFIEFKNHKNKQKAVLVCYCDFECYLESVSDHERVTQKHVPYSVGMYVQRCYDESKSEYKSYRQTDPNGETPQRWFVKQLKLLHSEIEEMIRNIAPMTNVQTKEFAAATICHICEKPFNEEDKRVKDHCHISGVYR